ncbi:acyl-CoA dehydrogenase family protein [Pseudonocardia sp. RS010]|uniref:acyl-CoA dehydrogenase family protein n=1 Tax=Pseudonocardia sp. RS010 TaxID=3385979 RepID=UPI0039A153C4
MDLTYADADVRFRERVRGFLAERLPAGWTGWGALDRDEYDAFAADWRRVLVDQGWLAPAWPVEYGGGGLSVAEQSILAEELVRAGAPASPLPNDAYGVGLLGPTLLSWGTAEQREYFLPRTVSGEIRWAQGYSEPEAGSDLFGLRTTAVRDGDEWVLRGEKVWQSEGMTANWIFVLARTDPDAPKAKGLSFLLVPIDQPGVRRSPIRNMAGREDFSGFVIDGARTAASNLVGGVHNGAKVALTLLGYERGAGGVATAAAYEIELRRLVELVRHRGLADDPLVRDRLARCYTKVQILRHLGLRALSAGISGNPPGPESSILKLYGAEYHNEVTELALDVLGPAGLAPTGEPASNTLGADPLGSDPLSASSWSTVAMLARAATIYGGSSQIQRSTIAEQILGLPREPRVAVPAKR